MTFESFSKIKIQTTVAHIYQSLDFSELLLGYFPLDFDDSHVTRNVSRI
jgi:hypothetical protein